MIDTDSRGGTEEHELSRGVASHTREMLSGRVDSVASFLFVLVLLNIDDKTEFDAGMLTVGTFFFSFLFLAIESRRFLKYTKTYQGLCTKMEKNIKDIQGYLQGEVVRIQRHSF